MGLKCFSPVSVTEKATSHLCCEGILGKWLFFTFVLGKCYSTALLVCELPLLIPVSTLKMDLASFASNINKAHLGTLNVKENWACMKWLHWNTSCFCKCRSTIIFYSTSLSSALWFFFKLSLLTLAAYTTFLSYIVSIYELHACKFWATIPQAK